MAETAGIHICGGRIYETEAITLESGKNNVLCKEMIDKSRFIVTWIPVIPH